MVDPARGGSVIAFKTVAEQEILKTARPGRPDATGSSCFAMVPFCNRIRHRRFTWQGCEYELAANTGDGLGTAHGFGWRAAWHVVERTGASLTIMHSRNKGDWPWSYRATQSLALEANRLSIDLSVQNMSGAPMPAGLGLHPYFPLDNRTKMTFDASRCWALDPAGFPTETADCTAVLAQALAGALRPAIGRRYFELVNHSVSISTGEAGGTVHLAFSDNCTHLALHVEPANGLFCIEPMTHAVGAFDDLDFDGRGGVLPLAAGGSLSMSMTVTYGH